MFRHHFIVRFHSSFTLFVWTSQRQTHFCNCINISVQHQTFFLHFKKKILFKISSYFKTLKHWNFWNLPIKKINILKGRKKILSEQIGAIDDIPVPAFFRHPHSFKYARVKCVHLRLVSLAVEVIPFLQCTWYFYFIAIFYILSDSFWLISYFKRWGGAEPFKIRFQPKTVRL